MLAGHPGGKSAGWLSALADAHLEAGHLKVIVDVEGVIAISEEDIAKKGKSEGEHWGQRGQQNRITWVRPELFRRLSERGKLIFLYKAFLVEQ